VRAERSAPLVEPLSLPWLVPPLFLASVFEPTTELRVAGRRPPAATHEITTT